MTTPSVLVVTRWLCSPADNGARIRRAELLGALAERFDVRIIALLDSQPDPADVQRVPGRVSVVEQPPYEPSSLRALVGLARRTPRAVTATDARAAHERVRAAIGEQRPSVFVADEIHTAHYAIGHGIPVLVEELQVGQLADDTSWRGRLTWLKNRDYHRRVLSSAALATTPSTVERDLLLRIMPSACIEVIPNGVDAERLRPDTNPYYDEDQLIYAGSPQYEANRDAVVWFAAEVLPLVRRARPTTRLVVTGATEGVALPRLDGVEFVGHLDDVTEAIRRSSVSVVPLRRGGGTRIKVLESLALGTPVVSTAKGVEGLDCSELEAIVAQTPAAFAAAILDVIDDPARRQLHATAGRAFAIRNDWEPIRERFVEVVAEVARSS